MKICKDGRVWGQNNKIKGQLGIKTRSSRDYIKKGYNLNSAGPKGRNHPMYGEENKWGNHSEESKQKMRGPRPNMMGKNNPKYKDGRTLKKNCCIDCNKRICWSSIRCAKCNKKFLSGKNSPNYGKLSYGSRFGYYKGILMKSSWEINIAKWLDKMNWKWQYEPKRFELTNLTYLPDFYLPDRKIWWEVKGWMAPKCKERINQFRELYPKENLLVLTESIYEMIIRGGEYVKRI